MSTTLKFDPVAHFRVSSFKHNGFNYRNWAPVYKLAQMEDCVLIFNPKEKTKVYETNLRTWKPHTSSVWVFPKNKFYNVVCMFLNGELEYYINVASMPMIYNHRLGFIDYDIDFKIYDLDKKIEKRDESEFLVHIKKFEYSNEIVNMVRKTEKNILEEYKKGFFPFGSEAIKEFLKNN